MPEARLERPCSCWNAFGFHRSPLGCASPPTGSEASVASIGGCSGSLDRAARSESRRDQAREADEEGGDHSAADLEDGSVERVEPAVHFDSLRAEVLVEPVEAVIEPAHQIVQALIGPGRTRAFH